ncbi:unnamed protein product [Arabis nemorensis]|uniref:Uncharacterized protein n=1 Tax=Arabis nemorensis TaxID=586526 RepID=A0A565AQ82_9BRAS|nr:unnamed protein product [Arabis nemorensis]
MQGHIFVACVTNKDASSPCALLAVFWNIRYGSYHTIPRAWDMKVLYGIIQCSYHSQCRYKNKKYQDKSQNRNKEVERDQNKYLRLFPRSIHHPEQPLNSKNYELQNLPKLRNFRSFSFSKLQKWKPSPSDDAKYMVAAKRLEEGLFRLASTKEDYLDPSTLESRLTSLIKARKPNNYNQIQQNANSSSLGTTTTPEVSIETAMDKEKKLVENGDQWETEIAEYLNSLSL